MTQEQTQMTDVDEDLANELLAFDEFVEDQTTTAIIEEVKEASDEQILVKATLPWNETVRRFFPHPKNDPGGEFQQLLAGLGLKLNAVKNLSEERVPCEYDGDEWTIVVPEGWKAKSRRMTMGLLESALNFNLFQLSMGVSGVVGWALLAPLVNLMLWIECVRFEASEEGSGEPWFMFAIGGILMLLIDMVWLLGMSAFHPYLIEAIGMVGALI